MKNKTISQKIWILSFSFLTLFFVFATFATWNFMGLRSKINHIKNIDVPNISNVLLIDMQHDAINSAIYKIIFFSKEKESQGYLDAKNSFSESSDEILKIINDIKSEDFNVDLKKEIDFSKEKIQEYINLGKILIEKIEKNGTGQIHEEISHFNQSFEGLVHILEKSSGSINKNAQENIDKSLTDGDFSQNINMILTFIGLILVLINSRYSINNIFSSLKKISDSFNYSAEKVKDMSKKIVESSSQLSETTTNQSSAIEETVSSMEEMSAMISQTNQNTEHTRKESLTSLSDAKDGLSIMDAMVSSMKEILDSNQKLEAIVRVIEDIKTKTKIINDIAFETKLLAFNASIEAARAGSYGRGFSVVAEEVGKLANVSGKAADEVRELLEQSVHQVSVIVTETKKKAQEGTDISQSCEKAFLRMESSFQKITDGIQMVSVATKEQDSGVKQTNKAMIEMEKITQKNSKNADKLNQYASDLDRSSDEMMIYSLDMKHLLFGNKTENKSDDFHSIQEKTKDILLEENGKNIPRRDDSSWV